MNIIKTQLKNGIILLPILALISACKCWNAAQTLNTKPLVNTKPPADLNARWNNEDCKLIACRIIRGAIAESWRADFLNTHHREPLLVIGDIFGKSDDQCYKIDAEPFMKNIEEEFLNSHSVGIIKHGMFREKVQQTRLESGPITTIIVTDVERKCGRELGADFILVGTINLKNIKANVKNEVTSYRYQANLKIIDLNTTNEVVWIGESRIERRENLSSETSSSATPNPGSKLATNYSIT